jgi:uncharacterized protein YcfL
LSKKQNQEIKQNTSTIGSGLLGRIAGKGVPYLYGGLLLLLVIALLGGCSTPQTTPTERVIPEPSGLTYSISISTPPIQISGGNLHWHKELPGDNYTLEDLTIEIYNFGNFDIRLAQLEVTVDEDTKLLNINSVIHRGERKSLVFQPMMADYDGGTHRVYISLLDENGGILYQNKGESIGPLEPTPGTGSWQPMPN